VIKLAGNFLITTVIEGLAEAFAFGRKFGVDPHAFLDILTDSLFSAPVYRNYGSMIASDKFEPAGFKLPLGLKDNRMLLAAAEDATVPMPMASLIHDRFVTALALSFLLVEPMSLLGQRHRRKIFYQVGVGHPAIVRTAGCHVVSAIFRQRQRD